MKAELSNGKKSQPKVNGDRIEMNKLARPQTNFS